MTIDGVTLPVEQPFFVVATQNPIEYEGTYPLPEAQLDRFTARLSLGYPPFARGDAHARGADDGAAARPPPRGRRPRRSRRCDRGRQRRSTSRRASARTSSRSSGTRATSSMLALGASPRAGIALLRMAKARAVALGRDYVVPEDVQAVAQRCALAPCDRGAGGAGVGTARGGCGSARAYRGASPDVTPPAERRQLAPARGTA